MLKQVHRTAAVLATFCIALFFSTTIVVELFGSAEAIARLKSMIVFPGLFVLIPAVALTGLTGFLLGKKRRGPLIESKKSRMPIVALNGILILLPAAILLDQWASIQSFDLKFYGVQAIELVAGLTNLILMGRNIRDGLRLTGRIARK